jgi:hypothetical protein
MTKRKSSISGIENSQDQYKDRVLTQIAARVVSMLPVSEDDSSTVLRVAKQINDGLIAETVRKERRAQ